MPKCRFVAAWGGFYAIVGVVWVVGRRLGPDNEAVQLVSFVSVAAVAAAAMGVALLKERRRRHQRRSTESSSARDLATAQRRANR